MSRGAIAFLGGLGTGGLAEYHRQKQLQRQDRLDEQQKRLIDLREQQIQMALDKTAQAKADRETVREHASTVTPESGYGVQDAFTKDIDAAGVMADMATAAPGDEATAEPEAPTEQVRVKGIGGQKMFAGNESGLAAARGYADTQNTPDGRAARIAEGYMKIGQPEKALEYQTKAEAFRQAQYDASIKTIYDMGLRAIEAGNFDALSSLIKPHLGGNDLTFTPNQSGGGTFNMVNQQGQLVSSREVRDKDDAMAQWGQMVNPASGVASRAKAAEGALDHQRKVQLELAKETGKAHKLGPGDQLFGGTGALMAANMTNHEPVRDESGRVTGYRTVRADKEDRIGAVMPVIKESLANEPDLVAPAQSGAASLLEANPGMQPALAADIGIRLARGAATKRTSFNPATGLFQQMVDDVGERDKKGNVIRAGTNQTYQLKPYEFKGESGNLTSEEGVAAVRAIRQAMPVQEFVKLTQLKTPAERQDYQNRIGKQIIQLRADAEAQANGKSDEEKKLIGERLTAAHNQLLAALRRMIIVTSFHGQDTGK